MRAKVTIKQILLSNQNWWRFYTQHKDRIRSSIVVCITKLQELIKKNFGFNPLTCILCGQQLLLSTISFGKSTYELLQLHRELALLKKV